MAARLQRQRRVALAHGGARVAQREQRRAVHAHLHGVGAAQPEVVVPAGSHGHVAGDHRHEVLVEGGVQARPVVHLLDVERLREVQRDLRQHALGDGLHLVEQDAQRAIHRVEVVVADGVALRRHLGFVYAMRGISVNDPCTQGGWRSSRCAFPSSPSPCIPATPGSLCRCH